MNTKKRIAIVYTKNPLKIISGMDMIRWHAVSRAMSAYGYDVDMVTAEGRDMCDLSPKIRVVPISKASWDQYCLVKACYQNTISLIPSHPCIVARLARVLGAKTTARDKKYIDEYLRYQEEIARRASVIIVNDDINQKRWRRYYGTTQDVYLMPAGCPREIPNKGKSPYARKNIAVFMGSLSSRRMVTMLNCIGTELERLGWKLVVIGRNRTDYYCSRRFEIKSCCDSFGRVPFQETWDYLYHADVGIALAPGPHVFENETSKLYYYLRAGLPVACEERISNYHVVLDKGWGNIFAYGDYKAAAEMIISLSKLKNDEENMRIVTENTIHKHNWEKRAEVLKEIVDRYAAG